MTSDCELVVVVRRVLVTVVMEGLVTVVIGDSGDKVYTSGDRVTDDETLKLIHEQCIISPY